MRDLLGKSIAVGRDGRGALATIRRGTSRSGSHALIPGATGAGKTTTLGVLLIEYVARSGFGAVVIEAKNDEGLRRAAMSAAAARGKAFRMISPAGHSVYDPVATGSVDERSERLLAVETWGSGDADFYCQAASPFLRLLIRALDAGDQPVTLRSVAASCDPGSLENLADGVAERELAAELASYVNALSKDEIRAVAGLRARLFGFADSGFAREWLDPNDSQVPVIDLLASLRRREVLYFRLDTDRTGHVGQAIAQMLLLDLGAAASELQGTGPGTFIGIDEFGAIEASAMERLYVRGRAAGMSVALGTQTVSDLEAAGRAVRERVGAAIESVISHRVNNQEDAEWLAKLIGAVATWETTIRTDGLGLPTDEGTRTRGYRFEVNPADLQRLARGEAYVARLDSSGARRAGRVGVVAPWQRLPSLLAIRE